MDVPSVGWNVTVQDQTRRAIPEKMRKAVASRPDIVEEIADRYRALGWQLSIDLHDFTGMTDGRKVVIGPVVTARFVPRAVPGDDNRLGHDRIAAEAVPGSVAVLEAQGCAGSILGGNAAAKLLGAGVELCIVHGTARDRSEIEDAGLRTIAQRWGVQGGRRTVELSEIGGPVVLGGTTVRSGDVAVANAWGMILIPTWLPWDVVLDWVAE